MVTTDLTIGKSELSFHYLFELIREKNVLNVDVVHKESVLYERISHDSLNRWIQRFNRDFTAYRTNNGNVSSELILNEEINFGEMFRVFFLQTGRFFLHDHKTEVIIVQDVKSGRESIPPFKNDALCKMPSILYACLIYIFPHG